MICIGVMRSSSTQDSESITSSSPGAPSQENKRSLNCSVAETSKANCSGESPSTCSEKRHKSNYTCLLHGKNSEKSDESMHAIINEWQLSNFTKCVYDNAVNAVLDSISNEGDPTARENALSGSTSTHDFALENEAVLMAIERKGLKQQDTQFNCSIENISETTNSSFSSKINYFYSSNDHQDLYECNSEFHQQLAPSDESQESNFEINFLTTAVSAAIEEKGLIIYAIREALASARRDATGTDEWFRINLPYTPENILSSSRTSTGQFSL